MAYNYSNPFAQPAPAARSTFAASIGSSSSACSVLFSGLPYDVAEKDLRDLLISNPLQLPASTTKVQLCHSVDGKSLGTAVITVGSQVDAEAIRRQYSGELIDATFRLQVQHILPPTSSLPSLTVPSQPAIAQQPTPQQPRTVQPFPAAPRNQQPQPKAQAVKVTAAKANGAAAGGSGKPEGLKLLARIGASGGNTPRERQLALLAQQKASLKTAPGQALLSRLNRQQKPSSPVLAAKPKPTRQVSNADKVARAKKNSAASGRMEVDRPLATSTASAGKARPKTQEELDEEMRVYERGRRFA